MVSGLVLMLGFGCFLGSELFWVLFGWVDCWDVLLLSMVLGWF